VWVYLEAGLETRALTIDRESGTPFMNDDQPGTWAGILWGIWLMHPLTYPGQKYADVSNRPLAMQASTIRCLMFPAESKSTRPTIRKPWQCVERVSNSPDEWNIVKLLLWVHWSECYIKVTERSWPNIKHLTECWEKKRFLSLRQTDDCKVYKSAW
jgi:hypothetical protein